MNLSNKTGSPELNPNNFMDSLCQGFVDGHFYGLEYVLDDFLENSKKKAPTPTTPADFDWFGLDG
jgi:hypothetical protein